MDTKRVESAETILNETKNKKSLPKIRVGN